MNEWKGGIVEKCNEQTVKSEELYRGCPPDTLQRKTTIANKNPYHCMAREFTQKDIEIFNKLAPELQGNIISPQGHQYLFLLRPVSHRLAQSGEDFKERLLRLTDDELEYLVDLALKAQEDIRGLDEEDMYAFFEVIDERIPHRLPALKDFLGIMG